MNPAKLLVGFLPLVVFSVLSTVVGAGWAALASLVVAVVLTATTAKDGIKTVPAAQAVILAAVTVLAFTGGPDVDRALVKYGLALQGLLLGLFMIATAAVAPFTAQEARSTVPPEVWHTRRFLEVNQHISTAWGLAVLAIGVCHLAGAEIPVRGPELALRLAVGWVLPLGALWAAAVYTRRASAAAKREAQERLGAGHGAGQGGAGHDGAGAHGAYEAGQVRA